MNAKKPQRTSLASLSPSLGVALTLLLAVINGVLLFGIFNGSTTANITALNRDVEALKAKVHDLEIAVAGHTVVLGIRR